jgi:DNA modification methylase
MLDTLLNCDCMEFMKTMTDKSVDMTLTDIPYDAVNKAVEGSKFDLTEKGITSLDKGNADVITFNLFEFLEEVDRITKGTITIFCGIEQMSIIFKFFKEKGYPTRQLIWEKINPMPLNGRFMYLSASENAVWVKKRGGVFNGFCESNVFHFTLGSGDIHPTEKNHDLLRKLIVENTNCGQLVFDPCAGSASTLLIAGQEGRHYLGCELCKEFYDKAINRLNIQGGVQSKLFEC